jgi:hypothetical protein
MPKRETIGEIYRNIAEDARGRKYTADGNDFGGVRVVKKKKLILVAPPKPDLEMMIPHSFKYGAIVAYPRSTKYADRMDEVRWGMDEGPAHQFPSAFGSIGFLLTKKQIVVRHIETHGQRVPKGIDFEMPIGFRGVAYRRFVKMGYKTGAERLLIKAQFPQKEWYLKPHEEKYLKEWRSNAIREMFLHARELNLPLIFHTHMIRNWNRELRREIQNIGVELRFSRRILDNEDWHYTFAQKSEV